MEYTNTNQIYGQSNTRRSGIVRVLALATAASLVLAGMSAVVASTASSATTVSGTLVAPAGLTAPSSVVSPDGAFELDMQTDGNLVVYSTANHQWLWQSGTGGRPAAAFQLDMQTDGNLVIYTPAHQWIWQSGGGHPASAYQLDMQTDGNLVIYTPAHQWIWQSGTGGHSSPPPPPPPSGGQASQTFNGGSVIFTYHASWNGNGVITVDSLACNLQSWTLPVLNAGVGPEVPGQTAWCGVTGNGTTRPVVGANFTDAFNCGLLGLIPYSWVSCIVDVPKVNVQVRAALGTNGVPSPGGVWLNTCSGIGPTIYSPRVNCYQ
ncbi:MAG TPA: hypothetical protein VNG12_08565 [Acidimicrobiales bacterium]|nr:hypothetical protein [Acidimicrobiales bacterium]